MPARCPYKGLNPCTMASAERKQVAKQVTVGCAPAPRVWRKLVPLTRCMRRRLGPDAGDITTDPALFERLDDLFGYLLKPFVGTTRTHRFPICIGEIGSAFLYWPLPKARALAAHALSLGSSLMRPIPVHRGVLAAVRTDVCCLTVQTCSVH